MRDWLRLSVFFMLFWTGVAAIYAGQVLSMAQSSRAGLGGGAFIAIMYAGWLLWVPLSVLTVAAVDRYPIRKGAMRRAVAAALTCIVCCLAARAAFVYVVNPQFPFWYSATPSFDRVLLDSARNNLVLAFFLVGIAHALHYARQNAADRVRIAELERGLERARLDALNARLNPHFLFNAMNTIAEQVHNDPDGADRMIIGLSALLRQSLDRDGRDLIPLGEELELFDHYLDIQKVRLGSRLRVERTVEPACRPALVPPLLLQPLAENAVVHGISQLPDGGMMRLSVWRDGELVRIALDSEGPGTAAPLGAEKIGLGNTRARLASLFGTKASLHIDQSPAGTTSVEVALPFAPTP